MRFSFLIGFIILSGFQSAQSQQNFISWKDIKESGKGTITIYWFPNNPYGYKDSSGKLRGIEVEIMEGFQKFLKDNYNIDLSLQWVQKKTFIDVMTQVRNEYHSGVFGVAGFSFSDERRKFMKFSPSYMADVAVLVSTEDIPIVNSKEDLKKYFTGTTALTAQGTVLEKELTQLRDENKLQFNIEYTGASEELINVLRVRKKSFGYLSLPVYLMDLDKGLGRLNRQNFLTKQYEGRGIGLSKSSDWDIPLNQYFASADFKKNIEIIIGGYVNIDLYHFINTFRPENEVSLLNEEKEIQQMQLKVKELSLQDKNKEQRYLIIIISIVSILFFVIVILFRRLMHSHKLLQEQKTEIEAQSDEIMSINDNLELMIRERTKDLENKNKALEEYAFITAHKLRAPLASILGLVTIFKGMKLPEEEKIVIEHLNQSAKKLDEVIHAAMDAIDKSSSPNQSDDASAQ